MSNTLLHATATVTSGPMELVAGADANISGKDGSMTQVRAVARIAEAKHVLSIFETLITVDVEYTVTELQENGTTLRFVDRVTIQVGPSVTSWGNTTPYDQTWTVAGKVNTDTPLPNTGGTIVAGGSYRIHGKGDDQTNCRVTMNIDIPCYY